jgi:hypothetical protein
MHLDVSLAAVKLLDSDELKHDPDLFLTVLKERDKEAQHALAAGGTVAAGSLATQFTKAVTILNEAVRGFAIDKAHKSFWSGKTREEFLGPIVFGAPPVTLDDQDDPGGSRLIQKIAHVDPQHPDQPDTVRMPRFRPPVPPTRVDYLKQWIGKGLPADQPVDHVGVENDDDREHSITPPADHPNGPQTPAVPGFAADIAPLFRAGDRDAMIDSFDLADVASVRANAAAILDAVDAEFMPCDEPWPRDRVELLRRWVEGGMPS